MADGFAVDPGDLLAVASGLDAVAAALSHAREALGSADVPGDAWGLLAPTLPSAFARLNDQLRQTLAAALDWVGRSQLNLRRSAEQYLSADDGASGGLGRLQS